MHVLQACITAPDEVKRGCMEGNTPKVHPCDVNLCEGTECYRLLKSQRLEIGTFAQIVTGDIKNIEHYENWHVHLTDGTVLQIEVCFILVYVLN
jgi:hypothetical protein